MQHAGGSNGGLQWFAGGLCQQQTAGQATSKQLGHAASPPCIPPAALFYYLAAAALPTPPQLIDFGLSKHLASAKTLGVGTPDYLAPEMLQVMAFCRVLGCCTAAVRPRVPHHLWNHRARCMQLSLRRRVRTHMGMPAPMGQLAAAQLHTHTHTHTYVSTHTLPPPPSPQVWASASNGTDCSYDARAVDAWAMGVLLFLLCTGRYPFEDPQRPNNLSVTVQNVGVALPTSGGLVIVGGDCVRV